MPLPLHTTNPAHKITRQNNVSNIIPTEVRNCFLFPVAFIDIGGARGGPLTGFTTRGRGTSQRGGVASHRTRGGSNNGAAARQPLRYDSDFDFDSANALFSKESLEVEIKTKLRIDDNEEENATTTGMTEVEHEQELLEEGELDESDSVESCYDKSLSFFDHISCEANSNSRLVIDK